MAEIKTDKYSPLKSPAERKNVGPTFSSCFKF